MADFTHYIGVWPRGSAPTNAGVIAGTGAITHVTRVDADGAQITQAFAGLAQQTDYDVEWVTVDDQANEIRATTVPFSTGVPEVAPPALTSVSRHILHLVELDLDACEHTYGQAPCTASNEAGLECFNTRKTCQDDANYSAVAKPHKLMDIDSYSVDGYAPCIERVDIAPTSIIPGGGLSVRGKISITLRDFSHHDRDTDPYWSTRTYIASDRGTYFGKLFARNPHYWGRPLRLRIGVPGLERHSFTEVGVYHFLIDKIEGPDAKGKVKITGRDPLMLADSEKSQCPPLSSGVTDAALASNTTNRIELTLGSAANYPAPGIVRINDELIIYEAVDLANDWLNTLTRGALGTSPEDHDGGALVQLCKWYDAQTPVEIITDLLTNYADVPAALIPTADWTAEQDLWFPGQTLTNVISEPTEVSKLLHDACAQSAINLFWDSAVNELKLLADYRTELGETLNTYDDTQHLLDGKSAIERSPRARLSQVWVYHTPHNYLQKDGASDFASAEIRADLEAESPELYGQKQVATVYADWLASSAYAGQLASRQLKRFSDPPITAKFDLDIREQQVQPGKHFYIDSRGVQSPSGLNQLTLMQMLSVQYVFSRAILRCEALSFKFPGRPALINDNGAPVYSPDGAHRARAYICDSTTFQMGNGDDPYQIV